MIESSAGIWFAVTKKGPGSPAELIADPNNYATITIRKRKPGDLIPEVVLEPPEKEK